MTNLLSTTDVNLITVAEVQLSYKRTISFNEQKQILSSKDSYDFLLKEVYEDLIIDLKECFYVLFLNRNNRVIGYYKVSEGGTAGTVIDAKLIFSAALKVMASSMILSHNHPSGSIKPSEADKEMTKKLVDAGKILDIRVLDHIIVTDFFYYSFVDEGDMIY